VKDKIMNTHTPQSVATSETLSKLSRRDFLSTTAAMTGGLFIGYGLLANDVHGAVSTTQVNLWLNVGSDNSITFSVGTADMGQGSAQGLAAALCEELMVDPANVKIVTGKPSLAVPAPIGASINTAGSGMIKNYFWRTRDAGAAAREMLISAAMTAMGDSNRDNYVVQNGVIINTSNAQRRTYGDVAASAATLPVPTNATLVSNLVYIGQRVKRQDIPLKVDGSAVYGIDVRIPNMVYAVIKHSPTFGGVLATTPARPRGAIAVVPTQVVAGTARGSNALGNVNALAVVAETTWDAMRLSKAIKPNWTIPANASVLNTAQFKKDARTLLRSGTPYTGLNVPGTVYTVETFGTPQSAIATSTKKLDLTYTLPYLSHACMEVLNCTVNYVAGVSCEVWAPTQAAKNVLTLVATLTGLSVDRVTVNTTFLGGGLGRKIELDFISQAVQVAMAINRPVKLMWSREEDFRHDMYRPMAAVRVQAGLGAGSVINGWMYRNVSPSLLGQRGVTLTAKGDSQAYEASQDLPYNFGARSTEWVMHGSPIPVGFWRSVGASINTFAVESAIDEAANAAGFEPYLYRRMLLSDPRWIAVLEAAANASGWTSAAPAGKAKGIAIGAAFNSICAQVVEVKKGAKGPIVTRVWIAIDCGICVNPDQVEAQLMGGVIHGMNAALYGQQVFSNGVAQADNFNHNRVTLLHEAPEVKVIIIAGAIDRSRAIGGVGELGVPTFAPALANAWFKLTKTRVRDLPFLPGSTMSD
jgi:isoquinoline 1-oxidoreductase beta subunit